MTTVIALTQLIFLTLGLVFLKGMMNANEGIDENWPWLFLLPIAWIVFAQITYQISKGFLTPSAAA
jgi:hypothetical protein